MNRLPTSRSWCGHIQLYLRVRSVKTCPLTALMVLCICLLMNNSWKFSNIKNPINVSQVGIRDGDWSKSNRDVSRTEPRFKKCSKQIGKTVGDVKITAPGGHFYFNTANLIIISYNLKSACSRADDQRDLRSLTTFKGISSDWSSTLFAYI